MSCSIYSTLPALSERDIRLIFILPRQAQDDDGQIICKLEVTNLDQGTRYHALSYTWGSPYAAEYDPHQVNGEVQETNIICNGRQLSVRPNLRAALSRIRDKPDWAERMIWVDAICIDQGTPGEQTSQVRLMADIFSSAETVMSWLGEGDQYTAKGFELIEKLASYSLETLQRITPKNFAKQESLLGQFVGHEYWEALVRLFQRTYFTRVWIIQEVVLAKHVDVFCGSYMSQWVCFENVSHFLSTSPWAQYFHHHLTSNIPDSRNLDQLIALTVSNHSLPTKLRAIKRDRAKGNYSRTFLYALIRSRVFRASDPRDKVYALLGLVGDAVKDKPSLGPEYGSRHVSDTYLLATKQLLEDADDLLILSCTEGQRQGLQAQISLPSWVPDWTCEKAPGLGITGYTRYSAAGSLPKYARVIEPPMTLELLGRKIDDISAKGESKYSVLGKDSFSGWLSIVLSLPDIYHTGEDRLEVFWRTLVTNTGGDPPKHPIDGRYRYAFVSWIVSHLASKYNNNYQNPEFRSQLRQLENLSTSDQMQAFFSLQAHNHSSLDRATLEWTDPIAEDYATTYSHTPYLRLFRTTNGHLGVGSESLVEGDSIWVICGSRVPLILRDAGRGNHQLVGASYLHGFMNRKSSDFNEVRFNTVFII